MSDLTQIVISGSTYQKYYNYIPPPSPWDGSIFEWFRRLASRTKGKVGEGMVDDILLSEGGFIVLTPKMFAKLTGEPSSSNYDRVVMFEFTEIKTASVEGKNLDNFRWQQIRKDQNYQLIIFVGVLPNEIKIWWATKEDLEIHLFPFPENRQHGGKQAKDANTYWITGEVPSWLRPYDKLIDYLNNKKEEIKVMNGII